MKMREKVSRALRNEIGWRHAPMKSVGNLNAAQVFDPQFKSLLVNVRAIQDLAPLLKREDRRPAEAVFSYLVENDLDVYIGGSVVRNMLRGRPKEYNDIDLLATGTLEQLIVVARGLDEEDLPFNYNRVRFSAGQTLQHMYLGIDSVLNYGIKVVQPAPTKASPIDLSLTTRRKLRKYAHGEAKMPPIQVSYSHG